MKKEELMKNVSATFGKSMLKLKKHSPEIMIVAGVIGTVTSTVLACRATTKLSSILDQSKNDIDVIHKYADDETMVDQYSKDDAKKDLAIVYVKTGANIAKLYAPSVALGVISITSIVASHNILKKRNVALAAAYATVDKTFKEYRDRVVDRFGSEVDKELRCNIKAKKIEETITDPESGKEKKVKSTVGVASPSIDEYSRFFDEHCLYYESNRDYNLAYLHAQQAILNDRLKADGFLFLSDVYDALGIKRTKMSQTVGWIYKPSDNDQGDNFVDFGILETYRETEDGGYEPAILLEFNVDGPILNLI